MILWRVGSSTWFLSRFALVFCMLTLQHVSGLTWTSVSPKPTLRDISTEMIHRFPQTGGKICLYVFHPAEIYWDKLDSIISINPCICGNAKHVINQQNQDQAIEFLQGLHDLFARVCSQILLMDPFHQYYESIACTLRRRTARTPHWDHFSHWISCSLDFWASFPPS